MMMQIEVNQQNMATFSGLVQRRTVIVLECNGEKKRLLAMPGERWDSIWAMLKADGVLPYVKEIWEEVWNRHADCHSH